MVNAFVALGSNLESPAHQIDIALEHIAALPQTKLIKSSPKYANPPFGYLEQPDFINAVCKVETGLEAIDLLDQLLSIEQDMGRKRAFKNGPRVIDLDLIIYGNQTLNLPRLIVPHPGIKARSCVLWPLYQIQPDIILPDGTAIQSLCPKQPDDLTLVEPAVC